MIKVRFLLPCVLLMALWVPITSVAQSSDTIKVEMETFESHSPKKASVLSAILPGAGQFYNKKYWKIPLVYGAIGTGIYFIGENTKLFRQYKKAYKYRIDGDSTTVDMRFPDASDAGIKANMEFYRRWRDIAYIGTAAAYILNILDASVDVHLKEFDVSEDLTLHIEPRFSTDPQRPSAGLSLRLTF